MSSDVMSTSARSMGGTAPTANPPPAYVAELAASHLISSELEEAAVVSPAALSLVNSFLDHVLYQIMRSAQSVSLSSLRASIPSVLSKSLTRGAVEAADIELEDYQAEATEEERRARANGLDLRTGFDLDLAWKLARLRCMVYTRLGDMEEDDEEEYLEQERLNEQTNGSCGTAKQTVTMTPLAAIFLTSVLEYLGEQALYFAAQNAQSRNSRSKSQEIRFQDRSEIAPEGDKITLDEADMLSLGHGSPLLKLWRSWRMTARSSRYAPPRPMSPSAMLSVTGVSPPHSRKSSVVAPIGTIVEENNATSYENALNSIPPFRVPLPMRDNDVAEIEVPGLAPEVQDSNRGTARSSGSPPERSKRRPQSMLIMSGNFSDLPTPTTPEAPPERSPLRPVFGRTRSHSLPTPTQTPYASPRMSQGQSMQDSRDIAEGVDTEKGGIMSGDVVSDVEAGKATNGSGARADLRRAQYESATAAAAGALSARASKGTKDARGEQENRLAHDSSDARAAPSSGPTRAVAGQLLAPNPSASAPKDVVVGPSIKNAADFENTQISSGQGLVSPAPRTEGSDPEDLALSSGEEDDSPGLPMHGTSTATATTTHPERAPVEVHSKRANRTASIYHKAEPETSKMVNSPPGPTHDMQLSAMSSYHAVTMPAGTSGPGTSYEDVGAHDSPVQSSNTETGQPFGASSMSAWPAVVPSHQSFVEAAGTAQEGIDSISSQHSNHSRSSSSSSRLLGFIRDAQGRPQTAGSARTAALPNGIRTAYSPKGSIDRVARPETAGSGSPRRQHLRIRSESEELLKKQSPSDETDAAKKRSLEMLINGNETLHYTLTPASARAEADEVGTINRQKAIALTISTVSLTTTKATDADTNFDGLCPEQFFKRRSCSTQNLEDSHGCDEWSTFEPTERWGRLYGTIIAY